MELDRAASAPASSSSCEISNTAKRIRKLKKKKEDNNNNKCKLSTSTLIFILATFTALELALFYGWAYRTMLPELDLNGGDTTTRPRQRIKGSPGAIRLVLIDGTSSNNRTEQTNEEQLPPLISVEERSKAHPWPHFPPLALTSPFVDFVHEGDSLVLNKERKLKTNETHKVARSLLHNGTAINVGFKNIDAAIQQQKKDHGIDLSVQGTWDMLESMGVDPLAPPAKKVYEDDDTYKKPEAAPKQQQQPQNTEPPINWTAQLPPWGQILDNYGAEPVTLGFERCQAYRDAVPPEQRMIAPAGMFSTGTNLLFTLLISNCLPPPVLDDNITEIEKIARNGKPKYKKTTTKMRRRFVQWQAPWGKHNPADARLHYATAKQPHVNQSAVFPIVMTRHPYTWIHTICKHSYSARWAHDPLACDHRAGLQNRFSIRFGSNPNDPETGKQTRSTYNGLTQFYRQWYEPFISNTDYPMAMARFEDLIYRPQATVRKICKCVGGRLLKKFYYRQETVNIGPGHGHHSESGLLPSFVKYGKPLEEYYEMFAPMDKRMLRMVFAGDQSGLLHAMGYKQFSD